MFKDAFSSFSNINQSTCSTLDWVMNSQSNLTKHHWVFTLQRKIIPKLTYPITCTCQQCLTYNWNKYYHFIWLLWIMIKYRWLSFPYLFLDKLVPVISRERMSAEHKPVPSKPQFIATRLFSYPHSLKLQFTCYWFLSLEDYQWYLEEQPSLMSGYMQIQPPQTFNTGWLPCMLIITVNNFLPWRVGHCYISIMSETSQGKVARNFTKQNNSTTALIAIFLNSKRT